MAILCTVELVAIRLTMALIATLTYKSMGVMAI